MMIQLKALCAIVVVLMLVPFQAAFAEVNDITVSEIEFKDISPCSGEIACGSQLVLTATLTNNISQSMPYVAFLELRDSEGVTIYLEFHRGMLDPGVPSNIASSWTPARAGEYELRVFAISDFQNPKILSTVGTTTTMIS